jgi:ABC-type Zn2+ transport system substrate-binding protein/surface adhesin
MQSPVLMMLLLSAAAVLPLTLACSGVPAYVGAQPQPPPLISWNGRSESDTNAGKRMEKELWKENRSWSVHQQVAEEKALQVMRDHHHHNRANNQHRNNDHNHDHNHDHDHNNNNNHNHNHNHKKVLNNQR